MPPKANKIKRKHRKSGEKLSPKDKKYKSIQDFVLLDKMATAGNSIVCDGKEDSVAISTKQWQELMDKIDGINKKTDEIMNIIKDIKNIKTELSDVTRKYDDVKKEVNKCKDIEEKFKEVQKTQELIGLLDTELKASEQENWQLKEKLLQQEAYTRRDNLLLLGIEEQSNENCENLVRMFLSSKLGIPESSAKTLLISRCHRLGRKKNTYPRPVIIKFLLHSERMMVWQKRLELKGTSFIIKEDFPQEIQNRRKVMLPLFKEAKLRDKSSKLTGERVTYKGRTYSYSHANELAGELKFFNSGQTIRHGKIAFYGRSAPYSNFYPAPFKEGATSYSCSEQMYQQQLCLHFADAQAARAVLLQTDPVEMKKIGDRLLKSNPDKKAIWFNNSARDVMKNAVRLKFLQNPQLCDVLKSSSGQLVEANPYDTVWGVGLSFKDGQIWDETTWKGTNWLGEILGEVRMEL